MELFNFITLLFIFFILSSSKELLSKYKLNSNIKKLILNITDVKYSTNCQNKNNTKNIYFTLYYDTIEEEEEEEELPLIKDFSIDLVLLQDESQKSSVLCSKNDTKYVDQFKCELTENMPKAGSYFVKLSKNITTENYTIISFTYNEQLINFVVNSVKKNYSISIDYFKTKVGIIDIDFEEDLWYYEPYIYFEMQMGKPNCSLKEGYKNILSCQFNETVLPVDDEVLEKPKTYKGHIVNTCRLTESYPVLYATVLKTVNYTNIKPINITSNLCSLLNNGTEIYVDFNLTGHKIQEEIDLDTRFYLSYIPDNKITIDCNCKLTMDGFIKCITQSNAYKEGPYKLKLDKYYAVVVNEQTYNISNFTSNNSISYEKEYNEILNKKFSIEHNYIDGDGKLYIFTKEILNSANTPTVTANSTKLNCESIFNHMLICTFTEEHLLYDKSKLTQLVIYNDTYITNKCGFTERGVNISIGVLKSNRTVITINKEDFKGKCMKYKEGFEFLLYYKKDIKAYNDSLVINNVKLYSKEDESFFINVNCTNKHVDDGYFVCATLNKSLIKFGDYYAKMIYDITDTLYKITKFIGTDEIYMNDIEYNKCLNESITIFHKYTSDQKQGNFSLIFDNELDNERLPKVNINNIYLVCKNENKNLLCEFKEDEFPYDKKNRRKNITYYGNLINTCGQKEKKIELIVNTCQFLLLSKLFIFILLFLA